ncbi:MAG: hypothetical protein ACI9BF_000563 [Candidatus Paceibacteria bacterium]|jgi:hypothetical protein
MKVITHIIVTHAIFLALFTGAALALAQEEEPVDCTADVMQCSDGSYVSRSGSECSFAECPAEDSIDETGTTSNEVSSDRTGIISPEERRDALEQKQEGRQQVLENIQEVTAVRQAQMEDRKTAAEDNIAVRRAALQDRAKERIINLAANVSNRMDAVIERIQNIIDRIESRMEKLAENGVDTSDAKDHLALAQTALDAALSGMSTIDATVDTAVNSEDVRAYWVEVKAQFARVRGSLKTAHTEIRVAVTSLKVAVVETQSERGVSDAVRNNSETEVESEESTN